MFNRKKLLLYSLKNTFNILNIIHFNINLIFNDFIKCILKYHFHILTQNKNMTQVNEQ